MEVRKTTGGERGNSKTGEKCPIPRTRRGGSQLFQWGTSEGDGAFWVADVYRSKGKG